MKYDEIVKKLALVVEYDNLLMVDKDIAKELLRGIRKNARERNGLLAKIEELGVKKKKNGNKKR